MKFLSIFTCTLIQTTCFLIMAQTKKTLWKEEKVYWEKYGFDNKLKKLLKWEQWKYDAYEAFMAKQKKMPKQPVAGKVPRKKLLRAADRKVAAAKSRSPKKKCRYHPGTVALRQIQRYQNPQSCSSENYHFNGW